MKMFLGRLFGCCIVVLVALQISAAAAAPVEAAATYRVGFISGNFKIFTSYLLSSNKPKAKEFSGCHNITVGYPEGWEFVSLQSYGKELYCYDLTFRLKDGGHKLCRLDLRSFRDASRDNQTIELHFKDDVGDINFVASSKAK